MMEERIELNYSERLLIRQAIEFWTTPPQMRAAFLREPTEQDKQELARLEDLLKNKRVEIT